DRSAGAKTGSEAATQVCDLPPARFEDARGEARTGAAGAVGHDRSPRRQLADAVAHELVRDVDRSRRVPRSPLRCFAHVDEERTATRARGRRPWIELPDAERR